MKEGCSKGLQVMEDLCGSHDTPGGTMTCEGPMLDQEKRKKQGTTERNCCVLTIAFLKGQEGIEGNVW